MILLDTQLNILLQSLGTWLLPIMKFITFLGTSEFFLILISAIYWCVNTDLGFRLGLLLLSSSTLNSILKLGFHLPRPYWVDERVMALDAESSFGFPSSHAQLSACVWGKLGFSRRNIKAILSALFIILLVGISRMYLGVHFSADVFSGWAIGFLLLAIFSLLERPISKWIKITSPMLVCLVAVLFIMGLFGLGVVVYSGLSVWQIPEIWQQLSLRGGSPVNPVSLQNMISGLGTLTGFIIGASWMRTRESMLGSFTTAGKPGQKMWRYLFGIAGVLLFWVGVGLILPHDQTYTGLALQFLRAFLVGGWISGLAPYLFLRTGLANPGRPLDVKSKTQAQ